MGLDVILGDSVSSAVHVPEVELAKGVSLIGGLAEPLYGLLVVLRYNPAFEVHGAEVALGGDITLHNRSAILANIIAYML